MYAIDIENLTKTYRNKKFKKIVALNQLHLTVKQGEVMGFLGPNGAGKSTTIKMVVGLMVPTEGRVLIDGVAPSNATARFNIGFLPENPAFYDYLSAQEYLNFVGRAFKYTGADLTQRCQQVLERVDLIDAAKRPIRTYSKGMVQRLGIAQTLVHDPDIYILDEPMSGLDPLGRAMVKDIIKDLKKRGKTVFFSSHITADVESICDNVAILKGGELQSVDVVDELLTHGVSGYSVHVRQRDGAIVAVHVAKEQLTDFLYKSVNDGCEVVLVEPCRKTLEDIFIDKIK